MEFWYWAGWLWWYAVVVSRCVGAAVVVRRWLAPLACWLTARALCWCRYAVRLYRRPAPRPFDRDRHRAPDPSTCRCCDGVDFDGMAGAWAVVTGCTDGIGKEYALQLADRGLNVALVSRNPNKLQAMAQEIHERHRGRIETRIVTADFTSSSLSPSSSGGAASLEDIYDAVRHGLAGLDVKLLVNNAGLAYGRPDALLDLPPCCTRNGRARPANAESSDLCRDVVECNALAAVAMCRIVMPLMLRSQDRGDHDHDDDDEHRRSTQHPSPAVSTSPPTVRGGVVINVSSILALIPSPLLSVYGATKAFLYKFSSELAAEYDAANTGESQQQPSIAVRCLTPGFVATKLSQMRARIKRDTSWTNRKLVTGNGRKSVGIAGKEADDGWLTSVISAVFDSPSSPFSAGQTYIATAGYPSHTLMVFVVNAARWLASDTYIYSAVSRMMRRTRDRMIQRDINKLKSNRLAAEVIEK